MICIAANSGGQGGIAGGAGSEGQASQSATGSGTSSYGYPIIETVTGVTQTFEIQLTKDYSGEVPADLSDITEVWFEARPSMQSQKVQFKKQCEFTPDGKVTLELGPEQVNYNNGVWYAEFKAYKDDVLLHDWRSYLCIRKGMDGSSDQQPNTITAMDVRLAIMDVSPENNQLLNDLEFSDIQIYAAVQRCIDEWEETPPCLMQHFNARTFPFREHLIKGVVGYLMQEVAYKYTRNRMQYNASGIQLDQNDKGPQYIALANQARDEWLRFVAGMKSSMNMNECFGTVDIPYFGGVEWGW